MLPQSLIACRPSLRLSSRSKTRPLAPHDLTPNYHQALAAQQPQQDGSPSLRHQVSAPSVLLTNLEMKRQLANIRNETVRCMLSVIESKKETFIVYISLLLLPCLKVTTHSCPKAAPTCGHHMPAAYFPCQTVAALRPEVIKAAPQGTMHFLASCNKSAVQSSLDSLNRA